MATHAEPHAHEEHHHHITPISKLASTFGLLVILMALTIFVAQNPFGSSILNNIIAIAIATIKATLVVMIFMGVKWTTPVIKGYVVLGLVGMAMMLIIFCDYFTRSWEPVRGWGDDATLAMPRTTEPAELGLQPSDKVKVDDSGH